MAAFDKVIVGEVYALIERTSLIWKVRSWL